MIAVKCERLRKPSATSLIAAGACNDWAAGRFFLKSGPSPRTFCFPGDLLGSLGGRLVGWVFASMFHGRNWLYCSSVARRQRQVWLELGPRPCCFQRCSRPENIDLVVDFCHHLQPHRRNLLHQFSARAQVGCLLWRVCRSFARSMSRFDVVCAFLLKRRPHNHDPGTPGGVRKPAGSGFVPIRISSTSLSMPGIGLKSSGCSPLDLVDLVARPFIGDA